MPDVIIIDRLELIAEHTEVILSRMQQVHSADYFAKDKQGQLIYDSLLVRLQAIGENIKKIEKISSGFIQANLGIDAFKIIRFRDFISHHYGSIDHAAVYNICIVNIPELHQAVTRYLQRND